MTFYEACSFVRGHSGKFGIKCAGLTLKLDQVVSNFSCTSLQITFEGETNVYNYTKDDWADTWDMVLLSPFAGKTMESASVKYPHTCVLCGSPAFNMAATSDCSNRNCQNG